MVSMLSKCSSESAEYESWDPVSYYTCTAIVFGKFHARIESRKQKNV